MGAGSGNPNTGVFMTHIIVLPAPLTKKGRDDEKFISM